MKVLIGILFIIFIWIVCDFYFGRKKHIQTAKKHESVLLKGEMEIFSHGPDFTADYFRELKQAKAHIHVLFYIVKNDQISKEFLDILKKKAKEGVEVRLMLDRLGSYKVSKKMKAALKTAGVEFAFSNRVRLPFLFYSSQVRNHRKITVIDGAIAYLGGFNIAKEYIDQDPKLSPWRDYHLKITGGSIPFIQEVFLKDWKEYAGIDLLGNEAFFKKKKGGDVLHQFVSTEAGRLEDIFLQRIQEAKSSIFIGTPYFIPSKKVFAELLAAIHRGVRLCILVPAKSDHILVREASFRYLRRLLKEGAEVLQFQNGFYHAKASIFDETICDVGTANFDKRSLFLNKEINCFIHSQSFISKVREVIQQDLQDSTPLLLKDLAKPNPFRIFKECIAGMISFFL